MEEGQVENIKEALRNGLELLISRDYGYRVETSLITPFENRPRTTISSTVMPTDEEALVLLDESRKSGKNYLCIGDPILKKINQRHAWLLQGEKFLGRYIEGIYRFDAIRKWDARAVETSEGRLFVPAYLALDSILTDLSFKRANDPQYMFNW
jgi:hypothetical protein